MKSKLQVILQIQGTLSHFCGLLLSQWPAREWQKFVYSMTHIDIQVALKFDDYPWGFQSGWNSQLVYHFPSDLLLQNFIWLAGKQTSPADLYITIEKTQLSTGQMAWKIWYLPSISNTDFRATTKSIRATRIQILVAQRATRNWKSPRALHCMVQFVGLEFCR